MLIGIAFKLTVTDSKNASDTASANVLVKSIQPANEDPIDNGSQNQDDKGTWEITSPVGSIQT